MPPHLFFVCGHINKAMEFKETLHPEDGEIKNRIVQYWTKRSHAFSELRQQEQESKVGQRWMNLIEQYLPNRKPLKILDVGCGTGMFALMLAGKGHNMTGIDLTEHMILHARDLAIRQHSSACFFCMDAEKPDFPENTFDAVISRNLTWTLPDAAGAYAQWLRILKPGGVLLNFDADYGHDRFNKAAAELPSEHAHCTMAREMMQECETIKSGLSISRQLRPDWDLALLPALGYCEIFADRSISSVIYKEADKFYNPTPMFLLHAKKGNYNICETD